MEVIRRHNRNFDSASALSEPRERRFYSRNPLTDLGSQKFRDIGDAGGLPSGLSEIRSKLSGSNAQTKARTIEWTDKLDTLHLLIMDLGKNKYVPGSLHAVSELVKSEKEMAMFSEGLQAMSAISAAARPAELTHAANTLIGLMDSDIAKQDVVRNALLETLEKVSDRLVSRKFHDTEFKNAHIVDGLEVPPFVFPKLPTALGDVFSKLKVDSGESDYKFAGILVSLAGASNSGYESVANAAHRVNELIAEIKAFGNLVISPGPKFRFENEGGALDIETSAKFAKLLRLAGQTNGVYGQLHAAREAKALISSLQNGREPGGESFG